MQVLQILDSLETAVHMPQNTEQWALTVAFFSLAVAIIGTTSNLIYTHRKFRQSTSPQLDIWAKLTEEHPRGEVKYRLTNLDSSLSFTDLEVEMSVRPLVPWYRRFRRPWGLAYKKEHWPLKPVSDIEDDTVWWKTNPASLLVNAIEQSFPGYFIHDVRQEDRGPVDHGHRVQNADQAWELRFCVSYRPAILGGNLRKRELRLYVQPQCEEERFDQVRLWKTVRPTRVLSHWWQRLF